MPQVIRYETPWGIPNAGPSTSVWHMAATAIQSDVQATVDAIRQFFDDIKALLPNDVTIGGSATFSILDTASGQLVGTGSVTQPGPVTGTAAQGWAAGAGGRILWPTDTVRNGRKIVGSTFLVPLASIAYDNNGFLQGTTRTTLGNAAATLLATAGIHAGLLVYSRPAPGKPGVMTAPARSTVPAQTATLRKRKY